MNKKAANSIRLGIFITLGMIIFIAGIYFIGARKNMFSSNTTVTTIFKNVGGLKEGSNVRFSGINVGSVERIEIISNRHVKVTLIIDNDAGKFIKKDAIAMVGSDGLMGDKVVNLSPGSAQARTIKNGDAIQSNEPVSIEDLMAVLQQTGQKAQTLVSNLASISDRINRGEGSIGKLFKDEAMFADVSAILGSFNKSAQNAESMTSDFAYLSAKAKRGEGTLGKLLVDESLIRGAEGMLDTLRAASSNAVSATNQIVSFSEQLNNKQSTVGRLFTDTTMATNLNETITNLNDLALEVNTTTQKINNSKLVNFILGSKKTKRGVAKDTVELADAKNTTKATYK